jgi:hypothetical protein
MARFILEVQQMICGEVVRPLVFGVLVRPSLWESEGQESRNAEKECVF